MVVIAAYTIVPRTGKYLIEAIAQDGSREFVGQFDTEDAAVRRLRVLQAKAGIVDQWNSPTAPKARR
jgi:hypothetical protein